MFYHIEVPDFLLDIEREKKAFQKEAEIVYAEWEENLSEIEGRTTSEDLDRKLSEAEKDVKILIKNIQNDGNNKLRSEIEHLNETVAILEKSIVKKEEETRKNRSKIKKAFNTTKNYLRLYQKICLIEYEKPSSFKLTLTHPQPSWILLRSDPGSQCWKIKDSSMESARLDKLRNYVAETENIMSIIPTLYENIV